jgi:hypothetical protein
MSSNISQHQEKATVSSTLVTAPSRRRFFIFTMLISRLGSLQGKTAKEASFKVQRWVGFRPDTWDRIAPLTRGLKWEKKRKEQKVRKLNQQN